MKKLMLCILFATLILGCSTKYQPHGLSGGYSDTRLASNIFNVSFAGNGYTSRERSSDFALLRAAELTMENGFAYFLILDTENYTNTYTTGKTYQTAGTYNSYSFNATTRQTGGVTFNKPRSKFQIICFKEKPNANGIAYEAQYVASSIRSKYNIN
ncbi:hypothetical protein ADMFC3_14350 [Geovibrio sp. ADMFC3]